MTGPEWCAFPGHGRPHGVIRMTITACEQHNRQPRIAGDHRRQRAFLDWLFSPDAGPDVMRETLIRAYCTAREEYEECEAMGYTDALPPLHQVLVALGDPGGEGEYGDENGPDAPGIPEGYWEAGEGRGQDT